MAVQRFNFGDLLGAHLTSNPGSLTTMNLPHLRGDHSVANPNTLQKTFTPQGGPGLAMTSLSQMVVPQPPSESLASPTAPLRGLVDAIEGKAAANVESDFGQQMQRQMPRAEAAVANDDPTRRLQRPERDQPIRRPRQPVETLTQLSQGVY